MNNHLFCRRLLSTAIADLRLVRPDFKSSDLSVTKTSFGGYEVAGFNNLYHYASSACCVYCAKAEAIDHILENLCDSDAQ